ncbi:VCBS repeat-containing protein [Lysobacter sp. 5GHs7-4]|uniref:FG-GAP repeat domain-containing protein n=1 Tax=Lysobacter sp. 5GHs7-4 TaxID=2904253 RepID=UPI001E451934|nr:VCBS repeat-containing protein [Lysobacter sp. 5GHs7-4]UHQ23323.1 VCBS repeat-containing protein [Lysobacter sp. 5GHs7-4]
MHVLGRWLIAAHLSILAGCTAPSGDGFSTSPKHASSEAQGATELVANSESVASQGRRSGMQVAQVTTGFHFLTGERYRQMTEDGAWLTYDAVAVGDVNGDGRADVVTLPSDRRIHVFVQGADGRLTLSYQSPANRPAISDLALTDLNEDGVLDVVATSIQGMFDARGGLNLLLSDGSGGWTFSQVLGHLEREANNLTAMDVDRDGHMDIVGIMNLADYSMGADCGQTSFSSCPWLRIMYGNGVGGFSQVETVLVKEPYRIHGARAADINGDGLSDLVFLLNGVYGKPGRIVARLGLPQGGFSAQRELHGALISTLVGPVFGDFNGDYRLDSLQVEGNYADVYTHGADGIFSGAALPSYPFINSQPVAADFDGDGYTDLVAMQMRPVPGSPILEPGVAFYLQRNGSLGLPTIGNLHHELGATTMGNYGLASGDLNGDGCRDLVAAAGHEGLWFFYGQGCVPPLGPQMSSGACRINEALPVVMQSPAPDADALSSERKGWRDAASFHVEGRTVGQGLP